MNLRSSILCWVALGSALLAAGCSRDTGRDAAMAAWRREPGHKGGVVGVAFSPDGSRIYSLGQDSTVRVWEAASGKQVQVLPVQSGLPCGMALSPDGKTLATGSHDRTIRVMDATSGKGLRTLTGFVREVCGVAFSPDGRRLATTDQHGIAQLWDTSSWEMLRKWGGPAYIKPEEFSARGEPHFSADGRWIAIQGQSQEVWVFEAATTRVARRLAVEPPPDEPRGRTMGPATLAHDNQRVLAINPKGGMFVWDTKTWRRKDVAFSKIRSRYGGYWVHRMALSPNDRLLAMTMGENAYLLDVASGKKLFTLSGHTGGIWAVAFSPDGKWLATGATDDMVMLWDVATGRAIRSFGTRPPPREMTDY